MIRAVARIIFFLGGGVPIKGLFEPTNGREYKLFVFVADVYVSIQNNASPKKFVGGVKQEADHLLNIKSSSHGFREDFNPYTPSLNRALIAVLIPA